MALEGYQLRAQLGAGPDGIAYRATTAENATNVLVLDLSRAKSDPTRWASLLPRLKLAAQLNHPGAKKVLDLELESEQSYAILEWTGATTLATASLTRSERHSIELLASLAGALAAAHRLGLPHGRLSAAQVFWTEGGQIKLDFTGACVGFPTAGTRGPTESNDERYPESPSLAALRSADLYALGALVARAHAGLVGSALDDPAQVAAAKSTLLGTLARELMAPDPSERPLAHEVHARLVRELRPMDITGDWSKPDLKPESATLFLNTDERPNVSAGTLGEPAQRLAASASLGRFQLLEKLGEGGQGIVYRALDPAHGSVVAIKVLRSEIAGNPKVLRRFHKEGRLMSEANNPHVVNLLEHNEDQGIPYLVLEFVAGASLGQLLAQKSRLDVPEALDIMAGVARGLVEAHERGIVHRDIKPANILLLKQDVTPRTSLADTMASSANDTDCRTTFHDTAGASAAITRTIHESKYSVSAPYGIKITDFGLARHVVDSESLAMTDAGALLGTPHYMAPEQWTGRKIDARTDVYAMGATLYHLLAGKPPFSGETRDQLCEQHCNEAPASIARLNPSVSEALSRAIDRALAKSPDERFPDAAAMLRDLESLRLGKPTGLEIHPRLPDCDPARVLRYEFRWELDSSPRQLWPFVTNTDRLDRAIGFAPVTYQARYEPDRGVRTFATGRKAGMPEVGEEFPYEWVEPRRMGILREYTQGPFKWLVSTVELLPGPTGGTTLIHTLRFEPASRTIRFGSRWGVGVGMRKGLEKVYRRIDATLQAQRTRSLSPAVDPFEEAPRMPAPKRERLERLMDVLVDRGVDVAVTDRLASYFAVGSAQEVARIRPLALAERFGLNPDQVVAACLHGAREGLLELHWDLLCPVCRISCQITDTLRQIAEHAHCEACHLDFKLDFANSIELIFRVHPEVREADMGTYCIGGPAHSRHVVAQMRVAPSERIELALELPEGAYRLRGPQLAWSADFLVQKGAVACRWEIDLAAGPLPERPAAFRSGSQVFTLRNPADREILVRVERAAPRQ
jgi:serine/threonine protein kinase